MNACWKQHVPVTSKLRPLLGVEDKATQLSLGDHEEDVIDFLKSLSGDEAGREVLAIIVDLLDTGYVHLNAGKDDEVYVWPYFYAMPLDKLTPPQIVELFEIVTAGDFEDMKRQAAISSTVSASGRTVAGASSLRANNQTPKRTRLGGSL